MKKLIALLLCMVMVLGLAACGQKNEPATTTEAAPTTTAATEPSVPETTVPTTEPATEPAVTEPAESVITPLLYKVTDSEGNVAWLFGSIHVGEEYFYPLPEYVLNAYASADALAVEFDIVTFEGDINAQIEALQTMVYADGTTIVDHISEELYNDAKAALKDLGMYSSALDYYCPAMWSSFIDSAMIEKMGVDTSLGIDLYFLNRAHEEGKTILDVESAAFQYGMMAGYSEELQAMLLESSVASVELMEESKADMMQLVDAWATGNEAEFDALINAAPEFESPEEEVLYNEYQNAMITQRNLNMADFAEDALKSGEEVFIVVGAAHIVGAGAMAELLAQRGYTVEIVRY
jgi:uncharacterized protein YbaP (TraB family)/predicted small lipoprotein YifL